MTEHQWLTGDAPGELVAYLLGAGAGMRKLRLYAAACCRAVWDCLPGPEFREAVEAAEAWADRAAPRARLSGAARRAQVEHPRLTHGSEGWRVGWAAVRAAGATRQAVAYAGEWAGVESNRRPRPDPDQCRLVRDVFGNPFRPATFNPSWRTETAVALARGMYEARDFGVMPVLADALDDAGCDHPDVLAHCRGPGPHVRGCWVVDLVLGKS